MYSCASVLRQDLYQYPMSFNIAFLDKTGSAYVIDNNSEWPECIQKNSSIVIEMPVWKPQTIDTRIVSEHINNIRDVMDPSITDLADIFDVSRQAVYKWLSGDSSPETDKKARIEKFSQIADKFKEADISRAPSLLKLRVHGNKSLMDLLKANEATDTFVDALIKEARIMEASYENSGLSTSKAKPTSDWQSYISIPGGFEQDHK